MGFNLKRFASEAYHQINPLDNGQTAATVRRQAAVSPPATTQLAQQPQQQRPQPSFASRAVHSINHFADSNLNPVTATENFVVKPIVNQAAAGVRSVYDMGRGAAADITNNPVALANANKAKNTDEPQVLAPLARPVVQAVRTLSDPLSRNTYVPKTTDEKRIFGDQPIQNIQSGIASTYNQHQGMNPVKRVALAAGYGAGQVAQDIPVIGGEGKVIANGVEDSLRAAKDATNTAREIATAKPARHISDAEVTAANRVAMQRAGYPDNTHPTDVATYRAVQQKLGVDPNNHGAVDNLIGSRMTYNSRMSQRPKFLQSQAGGFNTENSDFAYHPVENPAFMKQAKQAPTTDQLDTIRQMEASKGLQAHDVQNMEEANQYIDHLNQSPTVKPMSSAGDVAAQNLEQRKGARQQQQAMQAAVDQGMPVPGDIPTTNAGKVKKTRFTDKTVQNSDQVSNEVKAKTDAAYTSDTMAGAQERARQAIETGGHDAALNDTLSELQNKRGTASRDTLARAIELAAHHDAGATPADQAISAQLYNLIGEHGSASGQQSQILSAIARRSPAGLRNKAINDLKKSGRDVLKDNSGQINVLQQVQSGLIPGSPEHMQITTRINKLVDESVKNKQIRDEIQGHIDTIRTMPDGPAKDYAIAAFQKAVSKHLPQGSVDKLTSLWKAGLLSGVRTHGGNIVSNATFGALKKASDVPATAVDKGLSLITGKRTKALTNRGIASGTKEGLVNAADTLKTGIDRRNIGDKYEQHAELNFSNPFIQKAFADPANGVFRLLGAADQPTYYAALKNSLYDQAKAAGLSRGLHGRDLKQFMQNTVQQAPEDMVATAEHEANKAVLGYDTVGSKAVQGMHKGVDNMNGLSEAGKTVAHTVLNVLAPFVKVPSAFISRTTDFTPLGIGKEVFSQIAHKKFDQRALSQAIGEATTGTGIIALGISLAQNGMLSGDFPKNDPKEQARWKRDGITANSINLRNPVTGKHQNISLNYLGPLGLLFNAGHQIQTAKGESATTKAGQAVAGLGQGLLGQSFLQGFSGFSDAIQDPTRSAKSFINSEASSVIPGASNDVANATDKFQRQADTAGEAIKNRIPGLRESNPIKTDVYGNQLKQPSGALDTINPLRPSNALGDSVSKEVDRLHNANPDDKDLQVTPTPINRSITVSGKQVALDNKQRYDLGNAAGQAVQKAWGDAMKSDTYKGLDDKGKAKMLSNIRQDAETVAQRQYVTDNTLGTYDKAVTDRQAALANGNVDWSDFASSSDGGGVANIKGDVRGTALLAHIKSMSTSQRTTWNDKPLDSKYQDVYQRAAAISPDGLPDLPKTNATLSAYATYLKVKDSKPSSLKLNEAKKDFLKSSYSSNLSKDAKDLLGTYATGDKIAAANGSMSKKDVSDAIDYDNFLLKSGLSSSPKISNKVRRSIGVADAPDAANGGSGGGSGKAKTYSLYGSGSSNPISGNKKLRDMATAAVIKSSPGRVAAVKKVAKVRAPAAIKAVKVKKGVA